MTKEQSFIQGMLLMANMAMLTPREIMLLDWSKFYDIDVDYSSKERSMAAYDMGKQISKMRGQSH
jgi:hypothetical protein